MLFVVPLFWKTQVALKQEGGFGKNGTFENIDRGTRANRLLPVCDFGLLGLGTSISDLDYNRALTKN